MGDTLSTIFAVFSFSAGACIASFLNVVAWRVPRGESIVWPPSHCPKCNAPIRCWQNVPILSWLALRGKCAKCREPISPRYIIVEAIGGMLFLAAFMRLMGDGFYKAEDQAIVLTSLVAWWIWISLMIVGSVIDFDHKLLPDFSTVGGMVLGLVLNAAHSIMLHSPSPILNSLSGLAFGFGLLWLVRFLGTKAFRREAMGMGDVFLMGAIGAMFGSVAVLVSLILSSIFGSVIGVTAIVFSKGRLGRFAEIPYGPYICMGCLVWMFYGPELLAWYMRLLGLQG